MAGLFVKACDLFWAREDESESESVRGADFEASDDLPSPREGLASRGGTIKAVAQRWGVNEKLYRQLKAKMAVHGTLEARKKGRVGRKKKVTGALYDSFVIVNRDANPKP